MNYINLNKRERTLINKNYSGVFRFFLITGFISIKSFSTSVTDDNQIKREIKFYFNKTHPLFLVLVVVSFIAHIWIPVAGPFMFLAFLADLPDKQKSAIDIIYNMTKTRRGKGKKKAAIRQYNGGYIYEKIYQSVEPMTAEEWEEYYLEKFGGDDKPTKKSKKKEKTNKVISHSPTSTTQYYSETIEYKPCVEVKTYQPSESDLLPDPNEIIPEDEKVLESLFQSLQNGYLKSVEKYLKRNYNIYPGEFGYVLERLNRDSTKLYLDIDFKYLKVWEGDDKRAVLKTILKEIEKGTIQLVTKQSLIDVLDEFNVDIRKVPENKQDYLEKIFKISRIPEELKLKKAKK